MANLNDIRVPRGDFRFDATAGFCDASDLILRQELRDGSGGAIGVEHDRGFLVALLGRCCDSLACMCNAGCTCCLEAGTFPPTFGPDRRVIGLQVRICSAVAADPLPAATATIKPGAVTPGACSGRHHRRHAQVRRVQDRQQ